MLVKLALDFLHSEVPVVASVALIFHYVLSLFVLLISWIFLMEIMRY